MKNKVKLLVAVMMIFGLSITNKVNAEELEVGDFIKNESISNFSEMKKTKFSCFLLNTRKDQKTNLRLPHPTPPPSFKKIKTNPMT